MDLSWDLPGTGKWSFSKLIIAESCLRLFQSTYLTKRDPSFSLGRVIKYQAVPAKVGVTLHSILEKSLGVPHKFARIWVDEIKASRLTFEEIRVANSMKYQTEALVRRLHTAIFSWGATAESERKIDLGRLIAILDLVITLPDAKTPGAVLIDYKIQSKHKKNAAKVKQQLSFYAVMLFAAFPELVKVKTGCAYLRDGEIDFTSVLTREHDLPRLVKSWKKRFTLAATAVESLTEQGVGIFPVPARKVDACAWCQIPDCPKHKGTARKQKYN